MDGSARSDGEAEGATLLWVARNLATALWIDRALQHALLWPLLACPLSPMGEFGTDLHLLLNLRVLMCVMFCGSRVVMIATLGQMLLVCCAISSRCHVCKTGASCRVWRWSLVC